MVHIKNSLLKINVIPIQISHTFSQQQERLFRTIKAVAALLLIQLWLNMDCSPPGSPFHGVSQARRLQWVAISFRGSSQPRDWTHVSCVSCLTGRFFTTESPCKGQGGTFTGRDNFISFWADRHVGTLFNIGTLHTLLLREICKALIFVINWTAPKTRYHIGWNQQAHHHMSLKPLEQFAP